MNYNNAVFETSIGVSSQLAPSDLPEICFSGRSNVGKSSLINKLLCRKSLARVSTKPGKTITINFFRLENIRLADLPGYGYAKISHSEMERFGDIMETYFGTDRDIALVIQLVDMRHPPQQYDIDMLKLLRDRNMNFAIALTKSDKLNKTERRERLEKLTGELAFLPNNIPIIPFSSSTGEGVEEIRALMEKVSIEAKGE